MCAAKIRVEENFLGRHMANMKRGMLRKIYEMIGIYADPILGIDIGSSAVKLLQLGERNNKFHIEHYEVEPLPVGAVVEKSIKDSDVVVDVIKKIISKSNIKTKLASISVPNSEAIIRVIQVDRELTDKEIASEIELEADRYVPYALDEVNLDFEVMGTCAKNNRLVDVLLAVSKSENVDNRVDLLSQAGLIARIVDVDSFAIERAFPLVLQQLPEQGKNKIVALFDIGATITTLNVFNNMNSIYTKEQVFGGQHLIDEIQTRYGLSYEEAITARKHGDLPDDYLPEVLEPFKETVVQQVNRACQFFFTSGEHNALDYILLTGGTCNISGLDELVFKKVGVKTFIVNPFLNMSISKKINTEILMNDALTLMNCCGLALRNVEKV